MAATTTRRSTPVSVNERIRSARRRLLMRIGLVVLVAAPVGVAVASL